MWGRCDHRATLRYIFLCVWSNVTFKRTVFVASEGFVSSVIVCLFLFRVKRTLPLGCDRVWSVSQVIILLPRRLLLKRNRLQTSHHRYTHMPARKTFPLEVISQGHICSVTCHTTRIIICVMSHKKRRRVTTWTTAAKTAKALSSYGKSYWNFWHYWP